MAVPTRAPSRLTRLWTPSGPARSGRGTGSLALLLALALACAYAAFASGATRPPQDARLEVGVALLALLALGSWAQGGGVRWRASRAATAGLALLAALAAWDALSLVWSLAPDGSWQEANRVLAYVLVLALALAAGAGDPRAAERAGALVLGGCTLVALYAFGTKVLPSVHVPLLFDLDQSGVAGRLRAPLGYWNALALLCALGVPLAVRVACDRTRRAAHRAAALGAGLLLAVVVGLCYSRGGIVAVVVGLVVLTALGPARLRGLVTAAGIAVASVPVLAVAFSLDGTSGSDVALSQRSSDGLILLGVFVASLAVLVAAGLAFWRLERRVRWTAERTRTLGRGAAMVAALAVLALAIGLAASHRGLPGTVSDRANVFTETRQDDSLDPGRLVTTTSGNRWVWWKEAAGAWSDRPVAGWGAGSFRALHLRYRQDQIPVTQAHSVPLQLAAETGLVGLALFLGAFGLVGAAALASLRRLPSGRERELAAAGLAAAAAWLVHGIYDWDWNIPGVTLPALVLLGVVAGAGARPAAPRSAGAAPAVVMVPAALVACLVILSAVLPAWADGKASSAQTGLGADATDVELRDAAAQADVAARLDPLALRPLLAPTAIARGSGEVLAARGYLLRAVARQPASALAWSELAGSAFELADRVGFERAALRALELDPMGARARELALAAVAGRTPPGASATAVGTPLTPAPVTVPAVPAVPPAVPPTGATGATGTTGATGGG
jgi:O-Antigen ligase